MKRFVRYLYEYQNGKRVRNVGFVKVEESDVSAVLQIYGKGFQISKGDELELFFFYLSEKQCVGILQGKITNLRPMVAYRVEYDAQSVGGMELLKAIGGVILRQNMSNSIRYYAAVWGEEDVNIEQMIIKEDKVEMTAEEVVIDEPKESVEQSVYKITRKDIVNLPRQEWKLANNHFLVHGCRNFHHLVSFEKDGTCWLGVPGIYHRQEAQAAKAFGFGQFMKPDDGEIIWEEDERVEHEEFGYWCRPVHNVIKG